MEDRTFSTNNHPTNGISDTFRQFIEALVEEVVINGEPFDAQKKWLRKYSEAEVVDYETLESNITNLFVALEEWKTLKTKSSQLAAGLLAKYCYVSEKCLDRIFHANAVSSSNNSPKITDDQLYPIRKNGEWGYMDRTGEIVFMIEAPRVEHAFDFKEDLARITVGLKGIRKGEGFVDKSGKLAIEPFFDRVYDFSSGRSIASVYGKEGVIDKEGNWVVEAYYEEIKQPFPNLFICDDYLYDSDGREIELPFSVDRFENVSDGLLLVQQSYPENWGFVNEKGEVVIEPKFDEIDEIYGFCEGLCAAKVKRTWGYIDRTGKMVIKASLFGWSPPHFRNGLSIVSIDGKYGVIDKTGKLLFEPNNKMNEYYSFNGWDLGIIEDRSDSILVDKTGKKVRVISGGSIRGAQYGFAVIRSNDKYGLLNSKGEQVISCIYDSIYVQSKHFSSVKVQGKCGLVDNLNGKQVIPCKYDKLHLLSDNVACVWVQDKGGLVDTTGRILVKPQYDRIDEHRDLLEVMKDGKMGYIDKTGKTVYMES